MYYKFPIKSNSIVRILLVVRFFITINVRIPTFV
ncbi:hypothetical protein SAMN05421747_11719 [Parapedobacter composti]|uniref:Uncharacterized protein n=1 Tax=Parapedobacter composti TaxID=623281 RepID=A0A1I1KT97_9SPHI|nr:hypothetical protein SAMN05421747_11719 [Parapedobacter composti]